MDPLSAIGLAGNIIAFVEFTSKLVSGAYEIYLSTARMMDEHADLARLIEDVHAMTRRLDYRAGPAVTDDETALISLAKKCRTLSEDLIRALKRLQTKQPMSKLESFRVAWRATREKGNLESLEKRIDRYRRQILDRIVIMISEDTSSICKLLQQSMKTNEASALHSRKELQELRETVLSLVEKLRLDEVGGQMKSGNTIEPVRTPGSSGRSLVEIHAMLSRVTQVTAAISREDWILNKLAFDEMHNRELSIEDAHAETFRWLLYDPSDEDPGKDAEGEKPSKKTQENEATGLERGQNDRPKLELSPSEPRPKDRPDLTEFSEASEALEDGPVEGGVKEQEIEKREKARLKFLRWLNSGSGIFHIVGKLGSGKSTLMKLLSKEAKTRQELQEWAGGKRLVFGQLRDGPFSTFELIAAFEQLIKSKAVFDKRKVCFFIDGLDEFDGDHWKLARSLQRWSEVGDLKICVSSRPYNEFIHTFTDPSKGLALHALTRQDIQKFVEDEFEHDERFLSVYAQDKRYARLVESLVEKAEGVFLWVRLVMRELLTGMCNSYSISQLEEELDQLPEGLETLFRKLLTSIRKPDRMRAARTFLILTSELSFRNANRLVVVHAVIDELSDAHHDSGLLYSAELGLPVTTEDVAKMTHNMRDRLNSRCKGLIQISKSPAFRGEKLAYLDFIHRPVHEFLTMHDVKADLTQTAGPSFDPAKSMCMALLRLLKGSYRLAKSNDSTEPEEDFSQVHRWNEVVSFGSYFWLLEKLALPILRVTSLTETETSCRYLRELEAAYELLVKLRNCLPTTSAPIAPICTLFGYGMMHIRFLSDSNAVEAQEGAWLALCALFGAKRFVLDRVSRFPELVDPSPRIDLLLLASINTWTDNEAVKQALVLSFLEQGISPIRLLSDPSRCVPSVSLLQREGRQTTWTMFLQLVANWVQGRRNNIPENASAETESTCKTLGHYLEFGADPTVVFVGLQVVFPEGWSGGGSPGPPGRHSKVLANPIYFDLGQFIEVWDPPSKQDLLALWGRKHTPPHKSWGMSLNFARNFWQSIASSRISRIDTESLSSSNVCMATVVSASDLPRVDLFDAKRWSRTNEQHLLKQKDEPSEETWTIRI
ncbi:MAG: hypothetical protein Q9165_008757 [Trypethelium subeluteriae]